MSEALHDGSHCEPGGGERGGKQRGRARVSGAKTDGVSILSPIPLLTFTLYYKIDRVGCLSTERWKNIVRSKIHLRAGICCTAQPLPSGSLKKTNDPQSNT
jgi:hypothetical protein